MDINVELFLNMDFWVVVSLLVGAVAIGFIFSQPTNPIAASLAWTILLIVIGVVFEGQVFIYQDPDTLLIWWIVGAICAPFVAQAIPGAFKKYLSKWFNGTNGKKA